MKAQRLRRVFDVDVERCAACGGTLWIIACIQDRAEAEQARLTRAWELERAQYNDEGEEVYDPETGFCID